MSKEREGVWKKKDKRISKGEKTKNTNKSSKQANRSKWLAVKSGWSPAITIQPYAGERRNEERRMDFFPAGPELPK